MGEVIARAQAIMQIDDRAQLRSHRLVLVIGRRPEGAIGQYQVTFLAERLERGDQFGIVKFVQRRLNFAAALLDIVEQRQNLRTQKCALFVAQRVVGRVVSAISSASFGFLPSAASARDIHCAATIPLLK